MNGPEHIVIIGGGLAGARSAEALVEQGFEGSVTLIAGESHVPYMRPPLSKGYLAGAMPFEKAYVRPAEWYSQNGIVLRMGVRVTSVDRAGHRVELDDGTSVPYDRLVLATGAQPRRLPLPGADADGVLTLRTPENSDAIRAHFGPGRRIIVIGAGWIGLEVAAAARGADTDVTIVEMAELPLLGVLGERIARVFADLHAEHGVDLRFSERIAAITTEDGRATGIRLESGETIAAEAVIVGVGVAPDVALAESAGLVVDNGVLVDATLRTSDPEIAAVGDIANHDHPVLGRRIRVEHWATASTQPATAVAALLGGDAPYTDLPHFFSRMYDLHLEYIGYAPAGSYQDVVVRGDLASRHFMAFWVDAERHIKAVIDVDSGEKIDDVRPFIAQGTPVDLTRLADAAVPYSDVAG